MKKILFAIMAIALVLVSCNKNNYGGKSGSSESFSIKMSLAEKPTQTSAKIKCVPSSNSEYYGVMCIKTEYLSEYKDKEIADIFYERMEEDNGTLEEWAYKGEQTITLSCTAGTSYTALAMKMNKSKTASTIYKFEYVGATEGGGGGEGGNFNLVMSVVGSPTATTADIKCVPNDNSVYYFAAYAPAEMRSEVDAAFVAEFAYEQIAMYEGYGYGFEDVAMSGTQTMNLEGLDPETDFFACAVQIDEEETVYDRLFTCNFRTATMSQSYMSISISYDRNNETVTFRPSSYDTYGFYIETKEDYDDFCAQAGITGDGWAENIEAWIYTYAQYSMEFPTYSSTQTVTLTDWFAGETITAGTNLVAYAAPVSDGCVNGTGYGIVFAPVSTIYGIKSSNKMPAKMAPKSKTRSLLRR